MGGGRSGRWEVGGVVGGSSGRSGRWEMGGVGGWRWEGGKVSTLSDSYFSNPVV